MEIHEAADIFPLDEETVGELAKDIRQHGQRVPIELLDGKVIDGRRRLRACEVAGVKPKFRDVETDDPIAYVLSLNLHRRHLSETQRAMVGARARKWYDDAAKERQKSVGGVGKKAVPVNLPEAVKSDARDAVGKVVGVSGRSIDYATDVLEKGTDRLIAAVDADLIAVSTASRTATMPEDEQNRLVDRVQAASANGHRRRPRPTVAVDDHEPEELPEGESRGKGIRLAHEAINCLTRIPKNDGLRASGLQLVTDWIRRNK